MHPESGFRVAPINWKNDDDIIICRHYIIVNFFFQVFVFLLSSLVTPPSFMWISLIVLDLRKSLLIKGLTKNPEIRSNPCVRVKDIDRWKSFGYIFEEGDKAFKYVGVKKSFAVDELSFNIIIEGMNFYAKMLSHKNHLFVDKENLFENYMN